MTGDRMLRFAPHLGYLSQNEPLFKQSVGTIDPSDHIAFAAERGFAGVFDPWMIHRGSEEVDKLFNALSKYELQSGGITYAPFEVMFTPLFAQEGRTAWARIEEHLDRSIALADKVGAKVVEVVLQGNPEFSQLSQQSAAVEHLKKAGDRAASAGLVIGIEHMIALPNLMLSNTEAAAQLLDKIDHSAVGLIFDTGHVHEMDGDIFAAWQTVKDRVCTVQLADMPGRVEPGSGTIDFAAFLTQVVRDGKADGLIELEHGWTEASTKAEQSGIVALRQIEADVRLALQSQTAQ